MMNERKLQAVICDIEGTTTPIEFVRDTLFPYARPRLGEWLRAHRGELPAVTLLEQVKAEAGRELTLAAAIRQLEDWSDADRKSPALKTLQGLIWQQGYTDGSLIAPLYPDVAPALSRWRQAGLLLGIYSSGSVAAQKLLFGHSTAGDVRVRFNYWFDTAIGGKLESESYRRIAGTIGLASDSILFLSDHPGEVAAARGAGWQALRVERADSAPRVPGGAQDTPISDFSVVLLDTELEVSNRA